MALDKEKILDTAQKFADKNQYEKAIKELLKILDSCNEDSRVLLRLATYYEKARRIPEAVETLKHVVGLYRTQGAHSKALAVLNQALKLDPLNIDMSLETAELYGMLSLTSEALARLNVCFKQCEHQPESESYGRVLQMMVRVDSENVQTRMKYAQYLLKVRHDMDGAVRQYSLALAQLHSKDRFVEYVQTAREYLKIASDDTEVIKTLAEIYIRLNRYNDAVVIMEDIHAEKRTKDIHELLVKCYQQLRRPRDAVYELKLLARYLEAQHARQDVIEDVWMRAQKIQPDDPEVRRALEQNLPLLSSSSVVGILSESILQPVAQLEQNASASVHPSSSASQSVASTGSQERDAQLMDAYHRAMTCYHEADYQNAALICQRIIAEDEQHLPSLRLLARLYESVQDWYSLSQVERKIAKACYRENLEEAIQHVMRAEQCTPGAWENYNLLRVFGVDPARYGLAAPDGMARNMSGVLSAPQTPMYPNTQPSAPIPPTPAVAQNSPSPSTPASSSRPKVPTASSSSHTAIPYVRRTSAATPPAPPIPSVPPIPSAPPIPSSAQSASLSSTYAAAPSSGSVLAPPLPPSAMRPSSSSVPKVSRAVPQQPGVPSAASVPFRSGHTPVNASVGVGTNPTGQPNAGLGFVPGSPRSGQLGGGDAGSVGLSGSNRMTPPSRIPPAAYPGQTVSAVPTAPQMPQAPAVHHAPVMGTMAAKNVIPKLGAQPFTLAEASRPIIVKRRSTAEIPIPMANISSEVISDLRKLEQTSEAVAPPPTQRVTNAASFMGNHGTSDKDPNESSGGFFDENSNEKTIAMALDQVFAGLFNETSCDTESSSLAGEIPPEAMERVQGILQEIDFYASINLLEDAANMLNNLVLEFGDVGIIHDKKVQYGL